MTSIPALTQQQSIQTNPSTELDEQNGGCCSRHKDTIRKILEVCIAIFCVLGFGLVFGGILGGVKEIMVLGAAFGQLGFTLGIFKNIFYKES